MKTTKLNNGAFNSVPENGGKVKDFENVKRTFETAFADSLKTGADYSAQLLDLSTAIAYSVVNKCIDPQRKAAPENGTVSDKGVNPAMLDLKRGIGHDRRTLDNTAKAADAATRSTLDKDGNPVTETVDKDAENALNALMNETLSDGIDLVNTAACALLEQAAEHADAAGWLDKPYTTRRLSRSVYTRMDAKAEYKDVDTTPIQEVYREVRRTIQASRAVQTDPRNGYTYIEDIAEGAEEIYYRLRKYADIGGYAHNGDDMDTLPGAPAGYGKGGTLYTADKQTADDCEAIIDALDATPKQRTIIAYRLRGMTHKAIGEALNVSEQAVYNTLYRLQDKMDAMGKAPKGWTRADRDSAKDKPVAVVQMDKDGKEIARYASIGEASEKTGARKGNISEAANGKRYTAGGYRWKLDK